MIKLLDIDIAEKLIAEKDRKETWDRFSQIMGP